MYLGTYDGFEADFGGFRPGKVGKYMAGTAKCWRHSQFAHRYFVGERSAF